MPDAFELRLIEDHLVAGRELRFADDASRGIYVVHGAIKAAGQTLMDDQAAYAHGAASIVAGDGGAAVWRWELARAGSAPALAAAGNGTSQVKLVCPVRWPIAERVLMRLDSVAFPPGGCAFLHTHQGPGIRCLIDGGIRIDTEGHSTSYGPGGAWFEAGPAPVFAQAASDRPSRFIRVMVLPAELKGRSSITYVNAEDREKPKSQRYKVYLDELIAA